MKLFVRMFLLALPLALVGFSGCSEPDPRENPEFNEEAFSNPSAVKLEPTPKPK